MNAIVPDRNSIATLDGLEAAGLLPPDADRAALRDVGARYAIGVPASWVARIASGAAPALARQVLPDAAELEDGAGESADPTGDARWSPVEGVVRRYPDRVLLKPVLACPIYCRFCFRRAHVGPEGGLLSADALDRAVAWIAGEPALREVILTGGDPLILSPRRLGDIVARLSALPRIETLRVHTRLPVAAPERVTDALVASLETDKGLRVVVHANCADEVTGAFRDAVRRLLGAGIPVLAQTVLLRGVNDTPAALEALLRALLRARVTPTYLHQLDAAPGTARFRVPIEEGRALLAALRGRVPGDAWPTYVLDIAGGHGKVPIGPDYLDGAAGSVRDPWGEVHALAAPGPAARSLAGPGGVG